MRETTPNGSEGCARGHAKKPIIRAPAAIAAVILNLVNSDNSIEQSCNKQAIEYKYTTKKSKVNPPSCIADKKSGKSRGKENLSKRCGFGRLLVSRRLNIGEKEKG